MPTRRAALAAASSSLLAAGTRGLAAAANRGDDDELYIASSEYPWKTWADRAGEPWPPAELGPTLDAVEGRRVRRVGAAADRARDGPRPAGRN